MPGPFRAGVAALMVCGALSALGQESIVINEIHYLPDVKTDPEEFIELYNAGSNTVALAGWTFSDALSYAFPSTNVAPGRYVVVAQNPSFLSSKYGVTGVLGPFSADGVSRLYSMGERIVLRDAAGDKVDEVSYKLGFPWPTVGDPPGYSIELINPALDNDLGGHWRASVSGDPFANGLPLITNGASWKYRKGTNEASIPTTAWRATNFEDSGWSSGPAPIGYDPSLPMNTVLSDMRSNYSSVFLRAPFVVSSVSTVSNLLLEIMYNDGFKLWINGTNVLNVAMPAGEAAYNSLAIGTERESANYDFYYLTLPQRYLRTGTNVIAIQAHNLQLDSSDFYVDLRLWAQVGLAPHGPTPGARNSVYASNSPPAIRQVDASPGQPGAGEPVLITAKVTDADGVQSVFLEYQVVQPGNYIELSETAYTNISNWVSLPMNDAGQNGDLVAGDDIYSAVIPTSVQAHRRLIRYRITVADNLDAQVRVPYPDDPQPNFAYFVYNGVPEWQGAIQPGGGGSMGQVFTVSSNEMNRLPAIHLLAKSNAVLYATGWRMSGFPGSVSNRYMGSLYGFTGALVYDGKVYDHIRFRARGGSARYAMVKNMWKFDMTRGHDFEARDDWGRKYPVPWRKLNLGACIQKGDHYHRGEQGMFESVGSRLFQLAGVECFATMFATLRVIDHHQQVDPASQYEGEFWGLYMMAEQQDGRFLDAHGLPDSNYYRWRQTPSLSNVGPNGPTDQSDLNYILSHYNGATDAWWRTNWTLGKYYSYQTIVQGIHHYDINAGKNYYYYYHPVTHLWEVMPWDLDLSWAHSMYNTTWGGLNPLASRILMATTEVGTGSQAGTWNLRLTGARPALELEFKNRVRELRDLLFNSDQAWKLIDEQARLVRGPNTTNSVLDADRSQWDYNPKMINPAYSSDIGRAGQGRYYQYPEESATNSTLRGSFNATIQIMKNYVAIRSEHLDSLAADALIPERPAITYTGPTNFPINRLTFRCGNFSSPGSGRFAWMKWRLGEVTDSDPTEPWKYEIEPVWDSGAIAAFASDMTVPPSALRAGSRYRVRVQFGDDAGRAGNWSFPVEFTCGAQDNVGDLLNFLRITELMYNPPPGGFEYIELHNFSPAVTLDLGGVKFTDGIDYTFPNGTMLPPASYLLLIGTNDVGAFLLYYGLDASVPIAWAYSGALNNGGERLTLKTSAGGTDIVSFEYNDGRGWPTAADGAGHSMVLLDEAEAAQGSGAGEYGGNWRSSGYLRGSPGRPDPRPSAPTILLNEIAANTEATNELGSNDWIELYNASDLPVIIGPGWYLSDDPDNLRKWMIPSNTFVPSKGWVSFDEQSGFHHPPNIGFGISSEGEQVFLSCLPGGGEDRVMDSVSFKAQEPGWSLGRYPDGRPYWHALSPGTRDASNAPPGTQLVITEIMYHPPEVGGTNDNALDEFIELFNPTGAGVLLSNTNGPWRLDGGVSFSFPTNTVLGAGEYLLVVNFNPGTNLAQLELFRRVYSLTNTSLLVLGPYGGKLANSSERVAVEKPQFAAPDDPAWVIVDEVIYADQSPWPCGSDGAGNSLQRISFSGHGWNPENWTAQAPTPGEARGPQAPGAPTLLSQPLSQSVEVSSTIWLFVSVCGSSPLFYQWFFNNTPIDAATNATLILTNAQMTNAGQYVVVVSNAAGAIISAPALLDLFYVPVSILQPPQSVSVKGSSQPANYGQSSSNVPFTVLIRGTRPCSYQWRKEGVDIPDATNSFLIISAARLSDEGNYSVLVSNILGAVLSSPARLAVNVDPVVRQQPRQWTVVTGSTVNFEIVATGHPMPLGFRWRRDSGGIAYQYLNDTNGWLTLTNVGLSNGGAYTVVVTNSAYSFPAALSATAYLTVVAPPANLSVGVGSNATFSVSARAGLSTSKLRYQWQFNGTNLPAQTNTSLTLSNAHPSQEGAYAVLITNPTNYQAGFIASLTVLTPPDFDSDGDGMPDWWERAHGLNRFDAADASRDPDSDGMANLQEYLAGTDPQDGQSCLKLEIQFDGSVRLRFYAVTNRTYSLQYSEGLPGAAWNPLAAIASASTNGWLEILDPYTSTNRFYRLSTP